MDAPPVQYALTPDGCSIAYSVRGEGQPVVFLPLGLNHIQLAWRHDVRISGWLEQLSRRFRLVQYDSRGEGMSSRGLPPAHTMLDYETDLETVIDRLGLDRVVLVGYFYSAHVAIRYAVKHPERVAALVLVSSSVSMEEWPLDSLVGLAEKNWDAMLYNWVPASVTPEERAELMAFFKETRTQADWLVSARAFSASHVDDVVGKVAVPALVLHARDFLWLGAEASARLAARIPNAQYRLIDGLLPLGDAVQGVDAIEAFLQDLPSVPKATSETEPEASDDGHALSAREIEVLRLVVAGRSNQQIADALTISLHTVARHVSNIFIKTGAGNRAEAVAYAFRHKLA
jgi:pimeloyl-ACP methyl ester carboxylesterase/DNA-binding CsgD family transcriptional regulator